ncbi:MAG: two-component regulator propeller domain-containing protein, partial [Acidobacteriota bacterium]
MIRPATILLRLLLGAGATAMAAEAAPPQPVFERIDSRDGLAHNSVGAILQDRRGFVWIGTFAGLNRYDGVEFVVWRHDPKDPASLSSNDINGLLEDRAGNLWVGTGRGLDRMERGGWGRQRFRRYAARGPDGERVPSPIRTLFEDRAGSIWAGMPTGLLRYLETDDRVEWLRHDPLDPHSLAEGSVYSIRQDAAGMLWVLTASAPENRDVPTVLHRLTADGSGFDRFVAPDGWQATALLIDRSGRFWLNVAGLGTFDPASGRFHRPILERNDVAFGDLVQDQAGALWVSTLSGFLCFRPDAGEVSGPWPKVAAEDRLAAYAGLLIEDREERLWIGSRGGLFKWDRQRKPFRHIARRPGDRGSLSSDRISAVLEDRSGNLWLGTYGAGLNRLSSENAVANRYRHNPDDPTSLCHDTVWHLAEDPAGGFWLGVDDGLCRFDPATGHFHRALEASAVGAGEGSVRFIVPAQDGILWLATEGGLLSLDPASGEVRRHGSEPPDGPGHRLMHSLHLDDRGSLWLGTQGGGLEQLDLASGNLVRHRLVTAAGRELRNEAIYSFWPGADGTLWLGSGEGLSHYSPATGELQHLTTHDGLPGPSVFGVLGDHEGRLWLGTNQGLSRFDPGQSPGRQFLNFDLVDGIGNLEFNRHATARTVDGRFLFGGMSGLTAFRPEEIVEDSVVPEVALTRVRVGTRGGESIFHPTIDDALVLEPRQSSVAFEFAALDFTNSARTRYAYQLQGFDDGWIDNGA